jgi:hypothetical protein
MSTLGKNLKQQLLDKDPESGGTDNYVASAELE